MEQASFLAFDLGATSGRSILGTVSGGKLAIKELTRFPNAMLSLHGKYYWNIYSLYEHLVEGLHACAKEKTPILSIAIDTWGVDFALLDRNGQLLTLPRAYRDPYTAGMQEAYFQLMPREEVYARTGIQLMDFNSLFQLCALKKENSLALQVADALLFMPDALAYLLTGAKSCEYTIASTSQILNPHTRTFDLEMMTAAGLNPSLLQPIAKPGATVGCLCDELAAQTKLGNVPVVAVAGHDTAAAVAAVPADNERFAFLSSGTWSLMGLELDAPYINNETYAMNYTNEGGAEGRTLFMKNLTGMWLLEQCRAAWKKEGHDYDYPQLVKMATQGTAFAHVIDTEHPSFVNPADMPAAIAAYCTAQGQVAPASHAATVRCIFESLALKYKQTLNDLKKVAPFPIEKLHVIGGGAQNNLLNQLTADALGIPVVAGPGEATAIGNIMLQAKAAGVVHSLAEMRQVIRTSFPPQVFVPT